MAALQYPKSSALIITFLNDVRRHSINSISGLNPSLINVAGEEMYVYIKNLSPAQLSNDNPDVWRVQLPKRDELEHIKQSDKMFVLLGYDYVRRVYTSWNPYWCKQRLNVAESCSMYSRLSLQERVSRSQKIEKLQLQNDGDVVCIPQSLIGAYMKSIRDYYPEETFYRPVGSSIQKRLQDGLESPSIFDSLSRELFMEFNSLRHDESLRQYLLRQNFADEKVEEFIRILGGVFDDGLIEKYRKLFLYCNSWDEYKSAIRGFCMQSDFRGYGTKELSLLQSSLDIYVSFLQEKYNLESHSAAVYNLKEEASTGVQVISEPQADDVCSDSTSSPNYELDEFGKLVGLDKTIIFRIKPEMQEEYPDYEKMTQEVRAYYPAEATERMTPVDWIKLFDEKTDWRKGISKQQSETRSRQRKSALRVTTSDGMVVEEKNATETFVYLIKENYPDLIAEIQFGRPVIFKEKPQDPSEVEKLQLKELGNGMFANTKFNTETKASLLQRISDELGLDWKIEIIDA